MFIKLFYFLLRINYASSSTLLSSYKTELDKWFKTNEVLSRYSFFNDSSCTIVAFSYSSSLTRCRCEVSNISILLLSPLSEVSITDPNDMPVCCLFSIVQLSSFTPLISLLLLKLLPTQVLALWLSSGDDVNRDYGTGLWLYTYHARFMLYYARAGSCVQRVSKLRVVMLTRYSRLTYLMSLSRKKWRFTTSPTLYGVRMSTSLSDTPCG